MEQLANSARTETLEAESSDWGILNLLRQQGPLSVADLGQAASVTPTAVRQRLRRLETQGLVQQTELRHGRGRPRHCFELTEKGVQATGSNLGDLAIALWQEIRRIADPELRKGLLQRVAGHLAESYRGRIVGTTVEERMREVVSLFAERDVPLAVENGGSLPVLTALACPYPTLAEQDRGICAVERQLFSDLLGTTVKLTDCRLDGERSCRFQTS